jgi:hypothetical protein
MVHLTTDRNGNYRARKRLPDDVREEYGRLFGQRHEAKFSAPASTSPHQAKQLFHEWQLETDGQIAAVRAQLKGEGISLTPRQARALAGEWYVWFIARNPVSDKRKWESLRDRVQDALRQAAGNDEWERHPDPDDLWRTDESLRKAVRPVLADLGETAQFLATKNIALNNEARDRFLDNLYDDLSEALKRLIRIANGDYGPDTYVERFPKLEGPDNGETPYQLFKRWVAERKPAAATVESWRYVFLAMREHFKNRSAASIGPDEAQQWIRSLVTEERSAGTVDRTWITASKTVFGWATSHKYTPRNPFEDVKITVPKRVSLRETTAFLPHEYQTILKATLEITNTSTPFDAAKRWVPWLCA